MKFLDFKAVAEKAEWKPVLDWLNEPYEETTTEFRTELVVIDKKTKLFFYKKHGPEKGKALGIINYVANAKGVDVRQACEMIIGIFKEKKPPKREIPELGLHFSPEVEKLGLTLETCKELEIGLVKQKSIMAGKVAFRLHDSSGQPAGYIGKEAKKDGWFYPKGFARTFVYNGYRGNGDYCIAVPSVLDCALLHQMGFRYTVAFMGLSPTDDQLAHLQKFRRILLLHPSPQNTLQKLSPQAFVKSVPYQVTAETTADKIKSFF